MLAYSGHAQDLADLLTPSEYRDYQKKTDYKARMDLFREVLERYSERITLQIKQERVEDALRTLGEIRTVCATAREASERETDPKLFRSKQVKKLEIRLRKLVEALDDLKNSVSYEQRQEFELTADALERFRDLLLGRFFGRTRSSDAGAALRPFRDGLIVEAGWSWTPVAWTAQRRRGSGISGDQFTDAEYEKLRDAQEIRNRVKVFLEIAESRLDELDRRREEREWDKEEDNPLEFFTPGQLLRAYNRAVVGTMVNIDERAKYKTSPEKDIRKALEAVNKKASEFIPRLESVRQYAIDRKDEELFLEWREAKKQSDIALKGSQFGLGAPVQ